ncbi:MAG: YgiQ family radical SAM protein [Lachnospiraceae bacterium]
MEHEFLPVSKKDMESRGISQLDFVYVIGDAYVDHPSFGHAIISRILERHGYTVGIISQPDWTDENSITVLGQPRLAFLISAGNMDSCVNHYSVSKKRRSEDLYTPGGVTGKRPDYATIVYGNLIRKKYKYTPILIGGIEASLRRLGHYDYWSNKVKRSILLDSCADLLLYGMGEKSIVEVADALDSGILVSDLTFIRGTVFKTKQEDLISNAQMLPSFDAIKEDKKKYAESFYIQYCNADPFHGKQLCEQYEEHLYVVQNPPCEPLTQLEMDDVYALPYCKAYHPSYEKQGGVPALKEVQFSLISNRGCFGGCNFCALTFHQGRIIQSRSHESIVAEAEEMTKDPAFKGYIHDVGGPTANFRQPACSKQLSKGACSNRQCLFPEPCKNLTVDHSDYLALLRKIRALPGVKKVFIRSGIRFDYVMYDKDDTFLKELCQYHISGQLKVAPEHISDPVLAMLGKPKHSVYTRFCQKYEQMNKALHKDQYLVPYLMSSHPGSTLEDAIKLAEYLRDHHLSPKQVQDFYPTPSTISTCMYYTGLDPRTMKPVYVATNPHEKAMQRALIQFRDPKNYELVKEALYKCGREDLIGFGPKCLIPPRKVEKKAHERDKHHKTRGRNKSSKSSKQIPKGRTK